MVDMEAGMRKNRREALEQTKTTIWALIVGCNEKEQEIAFKELYKLLDKHSKYKKRCDLYG